MKTRMWVNRREQERLCEPNKRRKIERGLTDTPAAGVSAPDAHIAQHWHVALAAIVPWGGGGAFPGMMVRLAAIRW